MELAWKTVLRLAEDRQVDQRRDDEDKQVGHEDDQRDDVLLAHGRDLNQAGVTASRRSSRRNRLMALYERAGGLTDCE